VRPSAFAVVRLTTSSNLVGCWTGKSAGNIANRRLILKQCCSLGHPKYFCNNIGTRPRFVAMQHSFRY
jgi:hypothetical protein